MTEVKTKFYDYQIKTKPGFKCVITPVTKDYNDRVFLKSRNKYAWLKPTRSLFVFNKDNLFRKFIKFITDSKVFEYSILLTIAANCVCLGLNTMYPNNDSDQMNAILDYIEYFFLGVFTLECVMKIISYGLVLHPHAYLRSVWNIVDFVIVVTGLLLIIMEAVGATFIDVKGLRAIRVLRPLKLISNIPSLQIIMGSIIVAMGPLANIFVVVLFLIVIFALTGMNLFMDKFRATCYNNVTNETMPDPKPCRLPKENEIHTSGYNCSNLPELPTNQAWVCMIKNGPKTWKGPNSGITNYDNIMNAMLTVFQVITLEGWTDIMYYSNDVSGRDWPWIFYIILVLTGSFIVMNLILGVLSGEFRKEKDKLDERSRLLRTRKKNFERDSYLGYKHWIEAGEGIITIDYTNFQFKSNSEYWQNMKKEPTNIEFIPIPEKYINPEITKLSCREKFMKNVELHRAKLRHLVRNKIYFIVLISLVLLNAVILGLEHANQPQWLELFQKYANIIFVILFTIEIAVKIFAFGFKLYFTKIFNTFDFIIITLSILEIILTWSKVFRDVGISVLRCTRVLRIIKLTIYWDQLSKLFTKFKGVIVSISGQLLFVLLFILIFALLGMQLFGGNYNFINGKPRGNFDSFFPAIVIVFQIMLGEDWNTEMYNGINAMGGINAIGSLVAIYFIAVFVIGNYLLLNLFLAIIVDSLTEEEEKDDNKTVDSDSDSESFDEKPDEEPELPVAKHLAILNGTTVLPPTVKNDIIALNPIKNKNKYGVKEKRVQITLEEIIEDEDIVKEDVVEIKTYSELFAEDEIDSDIDANDIYQPVPEKKKKQTRLAPIPPFSSFFMFSSSNKFRQWIYRVLNNSVFSNFIIASILTSSFFLALEDPTSDNSPRNIVMKNFDFLFLVIFCIELCMKLISYGLVLHPGSFLRSVANWIDLIVVVVGILDKAIQDENDIGVMRVLRLLRVLRPVRAISRSKGLHSVLTGIKKSIKQMWPILIVYFLLLYMFSVIGVLVFKGAFYSCNQKSVKTADKCKGTYIDYNVETKEPTVVKRVWSNNPLNFDNVGIGILTLITVSTFEGYPGILFLSMDSTGENQGPIFNHRREVFLFYFIYIIVIAFISINLIIGLIIVSFTEESDKVMSTNARACLEFALQTRPRMKLIPNSFEQFRVWEFVNSARFENIVTVLIMLNTSVLCLRYSGQDKTFNDILVGLNVTFIVLFSMEMVVKLYAFGIRTYFDDKMNLFDFIVVIGSYVDVGFASLSSETDINLFRLFRVMRLLKSLRRFKSIRKLLWTFIESIKSLPWILGFIILVYFIFATIGMQFFGKIGLNNPGSYINVNNNFSNFLESVLLLFRCVTGEAWQLIMISCADDDLSKCGNEDKSCGNLVVAYIYFPIFVFACAFMVMNLFVAVIINSFSYLLNDPSVLSPQDLNDFLDIWSEYDINATGRIYFKDLENMLTRISPPLGFGTLCGYSKYFMNFLHMQIPIQSDGTVMFNSVLFGLARHSLKLNVPLPKSKSDQKKETKKSMFEYNEDMRQMIRSYFPNTSEALLNQVLPSSKNSVTLGKYYALLLIQKNIRRIVTLNREAKMNAAETETSKKSVEVDPVHVIHIQKSHEPISHTTAESEPQTVQITPDDQPFLESLEVAYDNLMETIWNGVAYAFTLPHELEAPEQRY